VSLTPECGGGAFRRTREMNEMPKALINHVNLHYHVTGRGVPIVFVHPPLLTSAVFNYQKAELSESCKVITFDIRGHGWSGRSEAPLSYDLIAEDMKQLLDHLNIEKAYVCGYSAGGGIALHAMMQHPDRFMGGILLSAMSEVIDRRLRSQIRMVAGLMRLRLERLANMALSWGNKDSAQTFRNLYKSAKRGDRRNILEYFNLSLTYNCTKQLSRIKQPVLLVYGQKNRSFYRYAEILHHNLPASSLYFMRGVGHQLPTKAGDRVNRLIMRWLEMQGAVDTDADRTAPPLKEETDREPVHPAALGKEWHEELVHSRRDL
jgi:pimeloyl-ACP methyl ester carboxylesterase